MPPQGSSTRMSVSFSEPHSTGAGLKHRQTLTGSEYLRKTESLKIDLWQDSSVSALTEGSQGVLASGEDSCSNDLELAREGQGKSNRGPGHFQVWRTHWLQGSWVRGKEGGIHV